MTRCEGFTKKGERCHVPVCRFDPHFCISHSRTPEAEESKRIGRLKGAHSPKKRNNRDALFPPILSVNDLLKFLNHLKARFSRDGITIEKLKGYGVLCDAFGKVLQNKKISDRIETLENELEQLQELSRNKV